MASPKAIVTGLGTLHESYPTREVTDKTYAVYADLFAAIPDAPFLAACRALAVERGRQFFPTPGELMAQLIPPTPPPDTDQLLKCIEALGSHTPHGWQYPRIETVRAALGDAITEAYVTAGGSARCFADADPSGATITRDIARRAFASALTDHADWAATHHALASGTTPPLALPNPSRNV